MKWFWTALAVVSGALLAAAGCNDYGNTFQPNTGALITFLSPSTITAGSAQFTLGVNGGGFVTKTVVLWNGQKLATQVVTDSNGNILNLAATVPATLVAKPGTATVQTQSPFSGSSNNGLSNAVTFVIDPAPNPVPTITSMTPTSAVAGSSAITLSITGTNFLPTSDPSGGSQVRWNTTTQTNLSLVSVSSTSIQATVPPSLLMTAGSATVTVFNPPAPDPNCTLNCGGSGGGGSSNSETFTITAAAAATFASEKVAEETPAVSADGRFVAYTAVQNGHAQVFVRDTCEAAEAACEPSTVLVSAAEDGSAANGDSGAPSMNADGRYVAFSSAATNLLSEAPKGRQVYLRDTCIGAGESCRPSTQLISSDSNGALVGTESILPSVSSSGRFVAFLAVTPSRAADSADGASASSLNSGLRQVFVRDTCLGVANCTPKTTRISLQPGDGSGAPGKPAGPVISGKANHVAIAAGSMATLFTRSVAVDDRVILSILKDQH